jgi:hypothetical protein
MGLIMEQNRQLADESVPEDLVNSSRLARFDLLTIGTLLTEEARDSGEIGRDVTQDQRYISAVQKIAEAEARKREYLGY